MYGTVGRFRLKPDMEGLFHDLVREFEGREIEGFVTEHYYRFDDDTN
jgi:hypothetical protein